MVFSGLITDMPLIPAVHISRFSGTLTVSEENSGAPPGTDTGTRPVPLLLINRVTIITMLLFLERYQTDDEG
jgi:hypothetical protein